MQKSNIYLSGLLVVAVAIFGWFHSQPTVQAQDNLTPGMLFGPLSLGVGEQAQLCFSYLSEGDITAVVHFRNLTTGEVSGNQTLTVKAGGGACADYVGQGQVVGMARGDGRASDWVSPSNALISTMSVVNNGRAGASVVGIPKFWLEGL
jgi:hypothetical protein